MNLSFLILVGTLQRVKVEALYNDTKTTDANRGCPGQTQHVGTLFKADVGLGDLPAGFSHLEDPLLPSCSDPRLPQEF